MHSHLGDDLAVDVGAGTTEKGFLGLLDGEFERTVSPVISISLGVVYHHRQRCEVDENPDLVGVNVLSPEAVELNVHHSRRRNFQIIQITIAQANGPHRKVTRKRVRILMESSFTNRSAMSPMTPQVRRAQKMMAAVIIA